MNGTQPLSRSLADQLAEYLGNSKEFWLDLSREKIQSYSDIDYNNATKEELLDFWKRLGGRYLVGKDIFAAQRLGIINIDQYEPDCVQPTSYDIRLGAKIYDNHNSDEAFDLTTEEHYMLAPCLY